MKKILYLLPFVLYVVFYAFIILATGGTEELNICNITILLMALLICGLGCLSKKKIFNLIGVIALFLVSFTLVKIGIENDYFSLAETKIAVSLLVYYLIAFIISKDKFQAILIGTIIGILLILFVPIKKQRNDGGTTEYRALSYKLIKWNKIMENGDYYTDTELKWFPDNFYSNKD